MKFALSTLGCPPSDLASLSARAKEWGYDGLELADLSAPEKLDLPVVCLTSPVIYQPGRNQQAASTDEMRRHIEAAHQVNCALLKIQDPPVRSGENRGTVAASFGQWLGLVGDYAAERRVTIVVENAHAFLTAREMWTVMEQANHPAVASCWDLLSAALAGEGPSVSVPVLNSRIQYALVKDATITPDGALPCKIGAGNLPIGYFLQRLRGIGYGGWITFQPDPAWLRLTEDPDAILADAIKALRQLTAEAAAPAPKAAAAHKAKALAKA